MAFVVLHFDSAKKYEEDVIKFVESLGKHAKERLPGFARPEWVEVVEELPKVGKALSKGLREYEGQQGLIVIACRPRLERFRRMY